MRVGRGALARPRVGGGREEVRGNGGPGFGGSRVPPVACRLPCTAGAARYRGACWFRGRARGRVRRAVRFPQSSARRGPSWSWGGQEGVWGNLGTGRCFAGAGGFGAPPGTCTTFLLLLSRSQSRAVVFPTSPSLLVEGVRSGTRRRRGPPHRPGQQVVRGRPGPVQCPHTRARGLCGPVCGQCPRGVRGGPGSLGAGTRQSHEVRL